MKCMCSVGKVLTAERPNVTDHHTLMPEFGITHIVHVVIFASSNTVKQEDDISCSRSQNRCRVA